LMEAYIDDYLVMLKRMRWSGKLGVIEEKRVIDNFHAWSHD
jgi:hypothetical protein